MKEKGFTIVELVVVMAISGILLGIGMLQFSAMQKKAAVEAEVRTIYSKLTEIRLEAMYTKTPRLVLFNGNQMTIYPADVSTAPPVSVVSFSFPVVVSSSANRVLYDAAGIMNLTERSICVEPGGAPATTGNMDSVVVSAVSSKMGKRRTGGACAPASIDQK
ncbi:type II secretion system GspH family protein [Geomonas sp. Red69]|uniref:pilus assembly FimT family protein n=1 Tax=Geomonas diazotrophica TaxID=2843197 RepID=UPI001C120D88|nr:type II secretion system protein [Geomonas diazotrophica]MBU5636147.1 type II secretion system GspH family protein [Geomonas diazotrophica]